MPGQAEEAPQDQGHVGAEHPPVGVELVQHHVAEPGEEGGPVRVAGQEAVVEHVGVGEEDEAPLPGLPPRGGGGVPVVGEDALHPQDLGHGPEAAELVVGQGLGGEEEEARGPSSGGLEHRGLVDQAFPGGGGVGEDHVGPRLHPL